MFFTNCASTMEGFVFDTPTMVKFHTADDEHPFGGIAFGSQIICGCCGGIVPFEDCDYIETLPWIPISDEILGDYNEDPRDTFDDFDTQIQSDESLWNYDWQDFKLNGEIDENP